eukprot:7972320-Pyramimonas_sp.AAC.1
MIGAFVRYHDLDEDDEDEDDDDEYDHDGGGDDDGEDDELRGSSFETKAVWGRGGVGVNRRAMCTCRGRGKKHGHQE